MAYRERMADVVATSDPSLLRTAIEVRDLYEAAASEPPLNESAAVAEMFARLYAGAVADEEVLAAFVRSDGRLVSFAYGHHWTWAQQQYEWAYQLRWRLGDVAEELDDSYSLSLLACSPQAKRRGLGRETLEAWLDKLPGVTVWLQTTDIESRGATAVRLAGLPRNRSRPGCPERKARTGHAARSAGQELIPLAG